MNEVLSLTLNRMYIILFCLMVFSLLFFILLKYIPVPHEPGTSAGP